MSSNVDRRIDAIAERLSAELVYDDGTPVDPVYVAAVVHAAADELVGAPIQDFVPLLVENEARDVFYDKGLRRNLPEDLGGSRPDPEAVTRSMGTSPVPCSALTLAVTRSTNAAFAGP